MKKNEFILLRTMEGKMPSEIAAEVGWTRASVSRCLSRLRKDGALASKRKFITSAVTPPTYKFMLAEAAKRNVKPSELQAMVAEAIATDPANSSFLQNILSEV